MQDWTKKNICINVFCYENESTYPVYVSNEKIENLRIEIWDLGFDNRKK